ncbi:MAG: serine/threonine protein kinase, partial [Microlunatus sp.]|nr:serine/threonine protein kinase [Microlunatus sp.]
MTCSQPGCPGSIADGYCDVCGSPGRPATAAAATPASTGQRAGGCRQPGCPGTVVDGYCDVCGAPGDASPAATDQAADNQAASAQAASVADDGEQTAPLSTITRGSS